MLFFIIGIIDDKISINANLKFILTFILISGVLIYDSSLILNNINFQFVSFNFKILGRYLGLLFVFCFY